MAAFLKEKKFANFKIPEWPEIRDKFPGLVYGLKRGIGVKVGYGFGMGGCPI